MRLCSGRTAGVNSDDVYKALTNAADIRWSTGQHRTGPEVVLTVRCRDVRSTSTGYAITDSQLSGVLFDRVNLLLPFGFLVCGVHGLHRSLVRSRESWGILLPIIALVLRIVHAYNDRSGAKSGESLLSFV